ncbi:CPBP family intramembrane glutamic endopeptidase [Bacillus sp. 31A1R]|uniref:CPBP family intramembrane glutamic endopeptidase n=1 Tax=Robertmurraya mangrovi TaxID=3098077 RepID=A0ABU5J1H9_9BACI|nr:CPBP family intramembrane glutamic endopeptidase [Bacillus sp. 31A1R]MDZ5473280.1 CPBP family intramembrane glutamic endopeptidase [Bacillus sp. 31A1R]
MKKIKQVQSFFKNHPFIFAFFVLVVSRIAGMVTIQIIQAIRPDLTVQDHLGWLLMTVYACTVVSLVYWTDTAKEIGLRMPKSYKEWLLFLPVLIIPLFILSQNGISSWGIAQNLVLLIAAIGVAVNEEVLFRGVLIRGFMKWGKWVTVLVPSIIFALAHSTNTFVGGDTTYALYQTLWTFAGAIMLTAFRIVTNSLYPLIVFHFILDFVEYFSTGNYGVHAEPFSTSLLIPIAIMSFGLMIYSLILLYKNSARDRSVKDERVYLYKN